MAGSWVAKITKDGNSVCAKLFDEERTAVAFVSRIAEKLKGRCDMKLVYHTIHIAEESCEKYPQEFPLNTKRRSIVIIEAEFSGKLQP